MTESSSARHFKSIKEFYDSTRAENIISLCEELKDPSSSNGEWNSWYYSLPDFAELLYDPASYRQKILDEARSLDKELESEIALLEKLSESEELHDFLDSKIFSEMMSSPGAKAINKALDHKTATILGAFEKSLSVLEGSSEDSLRNIIEGLNNQRDVLKERIEHEELLPPLLDGVEVDLEYPVFTEDSKKAKRIDVLLSKPDAGKYAIIELKQWTEDNIEMAFSEDDEGQPECMVTIVPGKRSQPHPAVKVRDVYKSALGSKLQTENVQNADIWCFVYLHNQMYGEGQLFKVYKDMKINIYDDNIGPNNILYTKLWYDKLLERLSKLFGSK